MNHNYELMKENNGIRLFKRDDGKFTVVDYSEKRHQYYSIMPGDKPPGGGQWCAGNSFAGIDYVAGGYSKSYAYKMFNLLADERANY